MNVTSSQSKLCSSCCNFYATQATQWLCSGCFKTQRKTAQVIKPSSCVLQKPVLPKIQTKENEESKVIQQTDKSRCFKCNKKVGLLGVNCKCQYVFCNLHRLPESHECNIDYHKIGQSVLSKNVQSVAFSKITQI